MGAITQLILSIIAGYVIWFFLVADAAIHFPQRFMELPWWGMILVIAVGLGAWFNDD